MLALSRTDSLLLAVSILSTAIKRKSQNGGSGLRICRAGFAPLTHLALSPAMR
jgi:hypothetical protein